MPMCHCRIDAEHRRHLKDRVLATPGELAKALESSVQETKPDNDAIKAALAQNEVVPGAEIRPKPRIQAQM
jgi:hypothetical protein